MHHHGSNPGFPAVDRNDGGEERRLAMHDPSGRQHRRLQNARGRDLDRVQGRGSGHREKESEGAREGLGQHQQDRTGQKARSLEGDRYRAGFFHRSDPQGREARCGQSGSGLQGLSRETEESSLNPVGVVAESLDVQGSRGEARVTFTLVLRLTPIIAILYWSRFVSAQQDPSRWEDLFSQHPSEFRVRYGITPYFEEPVRGQASDFSLVQQDFSTSAEVWRDGNNQIWVHAGLRYQDIHTEAILPDTGQPFPEHLWNVVGGATYRHLFEDDSMIGGSLSVGSASDQPFHSSRELVGSLTAFYRLALEGRDSWLFFLSYSNNRDYANSVPIPGIEYLYNPSREFHAMETEFA